MEREPKKERGGEGKGKEGRPLTALILAPFFAWSLTLVPWFFAPEPHLNACYAGYGTVYQELLAYSSFIKIRTQLFSIVCKQQLEYFTNFIQECLTCMPEVSGSGSS